MSICPLYSVPHHLWQRRARLQAHFDTKEHTVLESGFHGCCGSDNSEHPIELHRGHNPTTQKAMATSSTLDTLEDVEAGQICLAVVGCQEFNRGKRAF
jgi:hypothetical protein